MTAAGHPESDAASVPRARATRSALCGHTRLVPPDGGGNRASELKSPVEGLTGQSQDGGLGTRNGPLEHRLCH